MMRLKWLAMMMFAFSLHAPLLYAEDFYCEVLDVEGEVTLTRGAEAPVAIKEGDVLQVDDVIQVASGGYADISYDKDWNNVTRLEESSKITIKSIHPTTVDLEEGGVYAKLKALPKDSTFEVKTPTAIASVRGTEYRTTVIAGETEIFNLSDSQVFVYSFDDAGARQDAPVILANSQKTQVVHRGQPPVAPRAMEQKDFQPAERMRQGVERKVQETIAKGRVGKIQDVKAVERFHEKERAEGRSGGQKMITDKDVSQRAEGSLRSDESGKNSDLRHEPIKPISGDDARNRVQNMTGGTQDNAKSEGLDFNRGRSVFAGERSQESIGPGAAKADAFQGRGLGQPYFPSDENARSGGPEPAGFPSDRWKSGYGEKGGEAKGPAQNFDAGRPRNNNGTHGDTMGQPGPQNHPGQGGQSGQGQKGGGSQNRGGGGRPGPRR